MKNDKKILKKIEEIEKECSDYIAWVTAMNPMAATDRMVENIIEKAEELKLLHEKNFIK